MSNLTDRRVSPRIPCDFSVEYKLRGGQFQKGRTTNIGTRGMLLTMEGTAPPVEAELLFRFHLPLTKRPIQAMGNVRWAGQGFAGVEFGDLRHQAQDEIWRYYARESARQRGVRPPELSDVNRDREVPREGVLDAWWRFIRESE